MKSILYITAYSLSNKTAGQNYSLQLLNDLSKDYKIDVLLWYSKKTKSKTLDNITILEEYKVNNRLKTLILSVLLFLFPLFTRRFNFKALKKIRSIAKNYDYIYYDFSQVFVYSLFVKHPHSFKMCHDVIGQKYSRRKFAFFYYWFVKQSENRLVSEKDSVLCFSDKDKNLLDNIYKVNSFSVPFYINEDIKKIDLNSTNLINRFVFYGAWNRNENLEGLLWFIKNVLQSCHNAKFSIIGGSLPKEVVEYINTTNNVEYLGFVDDPYPIIASSKALIAPIFQGAGVKVKVVESLALGTPVIGTEVAFEGIYIPQEQVQSMYLVSTPQEYIYLISNFSINMEYKISIRNIFINSYSKTKFSELLRNNAV